MNGWWRMLVVAGAVAAAPALAHESAERAMGTVESVTPERLVIKASDGHAVTFAVTQETKFLRGEKTARPEDVRVGQRVVVHGKKAGDEVQAVRVKLASPAAPKK